MASDDIDNITEKTFTTSVRIYSKDHNNIDSIIINKLEEMFVEKCFKGDYIISITEITKRGMVLIDKDSRGGKGNVDVEFKAKVIHYNPGDVICNARILKITPMSHVITTSYAKGLVHIQNNPTIKKGKEGDIIPITVSRSVHYPGAKDISLIGSLLNFPKPIYYKLRSNPKDVDINSFKNVELSSSDIKKITKYDDVIVKFNKKDIKGTVKPLSSFTSLKEGDVIGKPSYLSRFSGFIIVDKSEYKNIEIIEQYAGLVFSELLEDYIKFTELYKSMDRVYTTSDFNTYKKYYT